MFLSQIKANATKLTLSEVLELQFGLIPIKWLMKSSKPLKYLIPRQKISLLPLLLLEREIEISSLNDTYKSLSRNQTVPKHISHHDKCDKFLFRGLILIQT